MRPLALAIFGVALALTSCVSVSTPPPANTTPLFITATLLLTTTPYASPTPVLSPTPDVSTLRSDGPCQL